MIRFLAWCDRRAAPIILLALIMAVVLWLTGCGDLNLGGRPDAPPPPAAPDVLPAPKASPAMAPPVDQSKPAAPAKLATAAAPAGSQDSELDRLRHERADLLGQLAEKNAQIKARQDQVTAIEREKELAPMLALCRWAGWCGIALALAGVLWALFAGILTRFVPWLALVAKAVPLGWQGGLAVAGAGLGLTVAARALGAALPWLAPIGLAVLVTVALGALAWGLGRLWDMTQEEAAAHPILSRLLRLLGVELPKART